MAVGLASHDVHHRAAYETVSPDPQLSTNIETAVAGSEMDARGWRSVCYTAVNDDSPNNTVQWSVYGANAADYSDEVVVQALADLAPLAGGSYSAAQAPYAHYRVKIHSKADGAHGTVTVRGIMKP